MKYRLGLDLGVGSIGSAIIELDEQNNAKKIIDAGVRIFEVSEGAEERRLKRTARKNLIRTRKRLQLLAQKLFEHNLWVNDTPEGTDKLRSKSPYKIRHDALDNKLDTPNYIGRAILHLAKHRGAGFVSASEEIEEDISEGEEKNKKKLSSYEQMAKYLKETNSRTIGEFFYKRLNESYEKDENGNKIHPEKRIIRQKKYALEKKIVDYAIPRYLVKDEFHQIWDNQAKFFAQMNTPNLKQEIYDILFYERPAAPYATGKCIYFRNEERLLKAHPLSELRRIYEETNNIRISNDTGKRKLSIEERDLIVNELLLKGKNAGKQNIKKLLNLSAQQKISLLDDKPIKAYLYSRAEFTQNEHIANLSFDELIPFIEFIANPINPDDINKRLYNEDALIQQLKPILKINDEKEIGNLLTLLPKGRGMLGISATKIILDRLKAEITSHREITDTLALTNPQFMAEEEIARKNQGRCFELPYYGKVLQTDTQPIPPLTAKNNPYLNPDEKEWGKIANPAVHMILNQIRLVVNEIIKIYGRPYDINIELGRDVGMSTKKKNEQEQKQRLNEKLNEEAKKYLKDHKLFINNKNILKYKLAKEQGWIDAYNPQIEISQNFSGMEIEHIIPQAKGGTDTYNNLCLVNRNDNLNKGDMFAYEYFVSSKSAEQIREILKNARNRIPQKAWRFEPDARELYEDFGDNEENTRYLTDTRYVAKMACRYLRAIIDCDDNSETIQNRILPVKGEQTAKLRRNWNLLGLEYDLMGIDVPRYIECSPYWVEQKTGEIINGINKPDFDGQWKFFDKTKNKEWSPKPRIDHRHHAMDAITVACANRVLIQQMAKSDKMNHISCPLPLTSIESLGEFRRLVLATLKNIKVSHKPNHSKAGQFHKETGRVFVQESISQKGKKLTYYTKPLNKLLNKKSDLKVLEISNNLKKENNSNINTYIENCLKLKNFIEDNWDRANNILEKENKNNIDLGFKIKTITDKIIIKHLLKEAIKNNFWTSDKFRKYEINGSLIYIKKQKLYFETGSNQEIIFYSANKQVKWEIISKFNSNQIDFIPLWKKENGKILWNIHQHDIIELNTPVLWRNIFSSDRCLARVKKFSAGLSIVPINSTNDSLMLPDRGLSFCLENKIRKIELTPFGKIKKKHKVLWDGKKTAA